MQKFIVDATIYEGYLDRLCRFIEDNDFNYLYGIPRGGTQVAVSLSQRTGLLVIDDVRPFVKEKDKVLVVDDIVDSGKTALKWLNQEYQVCALCCKRYTPAHATNNLWVAGSVPENAWVRFPWEKEHDPEDLVTRMLEYIGEDPFREGLVETPKRVLKAWDYWFQGYNQDPADIMKVFEDDTSEEMVMLKDIEMYSTCVAGSTFVETPKGRIPIQHLKNGDFIYTWDQDEKNFKVVQCKNPRITGKNKKLWRLYTDKDTLLCTGDHKVLTYTDSWVCVKDLKVGTSIVALNRNGIYVGKNLRPYINLPFQNRSVDEHKIIYESFNGKVPKGRHIHHIDQNPINNDPSNLTMLSISEHSRLHRALDPKTGFALFTDEKRKSYKKQQVEAIQRSQTKEVRKKRSVSVKKYWDSLTDEERTDRNHRVYSVEESDWREDVWCMDVPVHHNFVANGMVVHNCEHHMAPFVGKAHIAYIPDGRILGASKLARLLDIYARRLQIQERIAQQVVNALEEFLQPKGAACYIEAKHLCISSRGVEKQNSDFVTSALTGEFKSNPAARAEFFSMIK